MCKTLQESKNGTLAANCSDGTKSKFFDPGRVNFLLLESGWVGSAIFGLGLGLEILS